MIFQVRLHWKRKKFKGVAQNSSLKLSVVDISFAREIIERKLLIIQNHKPNSQYISPQLTSLGDVYHYNYEILSLLAMLERGNTENAAR